MASYIFIPFGDLIRKSDQEIVTEIGSKEINWRKVPIEKIGRVVDSFGFGFYRREVFPLAVVPLVFGNAIDPMCFMDCPDGILRHVFSEMCGKCYSAEMQQLGINIYKEAPTDIVMRGVLR
jgi:hypothetical protein